MKSEQTILIIEDEEISRRVLVATMRGFFPNSPAIREVGDLKSAREILQSQETGHIVLLLLDLTLPDGSGIDFLRSAILKEREYPILVLTADQSSSSLREALKAGADDFLAKPIDPLVLESKVKSLLQKEYYSPLHFFGKGSLRPLITLQHDAVIASLTEERVVFSVPMTIRRNTRVELGLVREKLSLPASVVRCDPQHDGQTYVVEAVIDPDLPLAVSGKLRRKVASLS